MRAREKQSKTREGLCPHAVPKTYFFEISPEYAFYRKKIEKKMCFQRLFMLLLGEILIFILVLMHFCINQEALS